MLKLVSKKCKTVVIDKVCIIRYILKNDKWELDAGLKLGGTKKYRKRFKTLDEAKVHAELLKVRIKNEGLGGFKLSRAEQIDAERALKVLKGRSTLQEACEFYIRYHGDDCSDINIGQLVDKFIDHKERQKLLGEKGASDRTIKDYKHRLSLLASQFHTLPIKEFRERDFDDWILKRGDIRGLTRTTKALFSFAVENKYIPENPIRKKTPLPNIGPPSLLTDEQWQSLVTNAISSQNHKNSPRGGPIDSLACVVLGLWCGIRPEAELERLDWSDINIEEGFVYIHDKWKVAIGRLVTIPECAKPLLRMCINQKGPVINPKNFRRRWHWLRKTANVLDCWDDDIMRHTFASMHYGYFGDKQKIYNELGHCNQSMLRHYVNHGAKMKKRAKEFFAFTAPLPDQIKNSLKLSA